jgi:hypothetical protein
LVEANCAGDQQQDNPDIKAQRIDHTLIDVDGDKAAGNRGDSAVGDGMKKHVDLLAEQ